MASLIRSAALTNFADVALSVGLQPVEMLKRVGLPLACLNDPDARVSASGVRRLLEVCAEAADVDDFGLRVAEQTSLSTMGPMALAVRVQPTVGAAVEAVSRYIHTHNESIRLRIMRRDDVYTLALVLLGRPNPARQSSQLAVGIGYRIMNSLLGQSWRPLAIQFTQSAPRNPTVFRRFLNCDLIFGADFDAVLCSAADLERPLATADPEIARYAETYVGAIAAKPAGIDDQVREVVSRLLPSGRCSIERVAEHFVRDRRTLHRQLMDCGTTFSDIVHSERAGLIVGLLADPDRSLMSIAEQLGFSQQSALARWFRASFGCTITQWRSLPPESRPGLQPR